MFGGQLWLPCRMQYCSCAGTSIGRQTSLPGMVRTQISREQAPETGRAPRHRTQPTTRTACTSAVHHQYTSHFLAGQYGIHQASASGQPVTSVWQPFRQHATCCGAPLIPAHLLKAFGFTSVTMLWMLCALVMVTAAAEGGGSQRASHSAQAVGMPQQRCRHKRHKCCSISKLIATTKCQLTCDAGEDEVDVLEKAQPQRAAPPKHGLHRADVLHTAASVHTAAWVHRSEMCSSIGAMRQQPRCSTDSRAGRGS